MPVVYSKSNEAVLRATATSTFVIAGNNSVSNVAVGTEQVLGGSIKQIYFSSNGSWTVARGSNTVGVYHGTGFWNLGDGGLMLTEDDTANVVVTLSGSSTGVILLDIKKRV